MLPPTDFESVTSTNSIIPANWLTNIIHDSEGIGKPFPAEILLSRADGCETGQLIQYAGGKGYMTGGDLPAVLPGGADGPAAPSSALLPDGVCPGLWMTSHLFSPVGAGRVIP